MEPWMGVLLFVGPLVLIGVLLSNRVFGPGDLPTRRDSVLRIYRALVRT